MRARAEVAGISRREALPEDRYESVAQSLSLLANKKRMEILYLLVERDMSVGELVMGSGGSFSAISQQLKLLTLGGMLERRRDGRNIYYRLKDGDTRAILALLTTFSAK